MLSIWVRFLAFLVDLSLGHILFHQNPDFFYWFLPDFLGEKVGVVVMLLIPTFVVRFYGTLLLGVSPGQWLCSLRVSLKWYRARLLGAVRVFLEIVGIPLFFLFQFPLALGRKSWGERLSGTRLLVKSQPFAVVQLLMVVLVVVISLLVPLFRYFVYSEGLTVDFFREKLNVSRSRQDVPSAIYSSNRFRFQTRSHVNEERFIILPSFEFIKIKNKRKIKPFFIVYDRQKQKMGHFKIDGNVDFLSILEKGTRGNPLFRYHYPKISQAIDRERGDFARMSYLEKYEGKPLLDIQTKKEIQNFVGDVFNIKYSKMWIYLITKGPFVRGYWEVKKELMSFIGKGVRPEVRLISLGDHSFLRLRQLYSRLDWPQRDVYIPTGTANGMVFRSLWEDGGQESEAIFLKDFFDKSKWYFDFDNIFLFPESKGRLTPFHVVDYFIEQDIDVNKRKSMEDYLLKFCFHISKYAVAKNDRKLESILLNIFDQYRFVAQTEYIGVRKDFTFQLNSIQRALKLQNDDFFQKEL